MHLKYEVQSPNWASECSGIKFEIVSHIILQIFAINSTSSREPLDGDKRRVCLKTDIVLLFLIEEIASSKWKGLSRAISTAAIGITNVFAPFSLVFQKRLNDLPKLV